MGGEIGQILLLLLIVCLAPVSLTIAMFLGVYIIVRLLRWWAEFSNVYCINQGIGVLFISLFGIALTGFLLGTVVTVWTALLS